MMWRSLGVTSMAATFALKAFFDGIGKSHIHTMFVMVVEFILHFTCLVPLAYVLGIVLGFGLMGIWGAAVLYVLLLGVIMVWKFRSGDWQRIRLEGAAEPQPATSGERTDGPPEGDPRAGQSEA